MKCMAKLIHLCWRKTLKVVIVTTRTSEVIKGGYQRRVRQELWASLCSTSWWSWRLFLLIWYLRIWFRGGLDRDWFMVELYDLKGLSWPKQLYDSMTSTPFCCKALCYQVLQVLTFVLICLGVSVRKMEEFGSLALILVCAPCRAGKKTEWSKAGLGCPILGATSRVILK